MRRFIYFHIDELNRDAITASVLNAELKKNGWTLIYGNRFTSKILRFFEWAFDVVILPKPAFMKAYFPTDQIPNLVAKYVMLYTENIGVIANYKYSKMLHRCALDPDFMEGKTAAVDKVAAFCFWGKQVANEIKNKFPHLANQCHVVGHPRHDKRAIKKTTLSFEQKSVGIITRYVALNDYFVRHPMLALVSRYMTDIQYEYIHPITGDYLISKKRGDKPDDDLILEIIDIRNTVILIKKLINHGYRVSIKIHPRENPLLWVSALDGLDVEIADSAQTFAEWALRQRCVIGPPSTSFYDCLMLNIQPISIANLDSMRSKFVNEIYEENNRLTPYVIAPYTFDGVLSEVKNLNGNLVLDEKIVEVLDAEANFPKCETSITELRLVLEKVLLNSLPRKFSRDIGICIYVLTSYLLNLVGYVYSKVVHKNVNSALFFLTFTTIRKIDKMIHVE